MATQTKLLTFAEFDRISNPPEARYELRHGERAEFDAPVGSRRARQVQVGEGAVRRTEVDPDQVTWHVSRIPEAMVPAYCRESLL